MNYIVKGCEQNI